MSMQFFRVHPRTGFLKFLKSELKPVKDDSCLYPSLSAEAALRYIADRERTEKLLQVFIDVWLRRYPEAPRREIQTFLGILGEAAEICDFAESQGRIEELTVEDIVRKVEDAWKVTEPDFYETQPPSKEKL